MILHSLRVTHWRSLLSPVELGPFHERLNVIHAPNGTGKSSVFEALRRVLFDVHHVSGEEIQAVRPWGRSLAPQVLVEFTQSGVRYRVEKTFLDDASAHLFRLEQGKYQPLADGRQADSKLREILAATDAPGRGLSKQEHWGLAEVLWAPQGGLQLTALSTSVTENLRSALGVQLTGDSGSRLEELLAERYETYFTKVGKQRTGKQAAPLIALTEEHERISAERQQRLLQQQRFEETGRAVEDARQKRSQARHEADGVRDIVAHTRQQAEHYTRLRDELEQKRQLELAAQERFVAIDKACELIGRTRADVARLQAAVHSGEALLADLTPELQQAADAVAAARQKREEARRRRTQLDALVVALEDARAFGEDGKTHQSLSLRVEKLQRLEAELRTSKAKRAAVVAPDDKTIRDVRRHLATRNEAEAALRASQIHLIVQPELTTTITRQSPKEQETVAAGAKAVFSGSPDVTIEIKGFGMISASGPEGEAGAHQVRLDDATRKLAKLTQPYGTQDPDRLQLLRKQCEDLERTVGQLEEQIAEVLDEDDPDELQRQLAELEASIKERLARFPAWASQPPVISDLKADLEQKRKTIEGDIEQAEDAFETAQSVFQASEKNQGKADLELKNARMNLEAAAASHQELTKDGQTDAARQRTRQEVLMAWEAAKVKASACETKLAAIPGDPQQTVQKLERSLQALEAAEAQARDDEKTAEGRLQTLAAEGAYSQLAACEETLADLADRIRREKLRMDATRLLYETVSACKAAIVAAVAAPVERNATRMLGRIAGSRLGAVRLTENFVPAAVKPEIATDAVDLTNLSGGEQEQLFLITRLALGQVLAQNERQLVVLDDVLNATDTGRLARMLTLLEECADQLQIVILTCHPERYRALEGAAYFDLQQLSGGN